MRKLIYKIKAVWYGECPRCHVLLVEQKGWGRSDCPVCHDHYRSL